MVQTAFPQPPTDSAGHFGLLLSEQEFELFRNVIRECCGIRIAETKRLLLQNRIGRRVRALDLGSFRAYYRYLKSPDGQKNELKHFWSAVTTNETHFFREAHHFDILRDHLLPELLKTRAQSKHIRVWSAACSTGQEVYTLGIVLSEALRHHPGWRFSILGSDIDDEVLSVARAAEYPRALQREIPNKYLLRHFETQEGILRVRPELRRTASFRHHNLAEVAPLRPRVDLIFCRNAIMYLDKPTRARLAEVFRDSLLPGGYLLLGSAESLHGLPRIFATHRLGRTLVYQNDPKREVSRE